MKKKTTSIAVILIAVLAVATAFALLSGYYEFTNTLSIKGVGVNVYDWIDDLTTPTVLVTSHDWNKMAGGETKYFEYVCVENYGTENVTLVFSDTLSATIGSVTWWIEYYDNSIWKWYNWEVGITNEIGYIPGHTSNPVEPAAILGLRPATPSDYDLGRIRIELTTTASPPFGAVTPFDITVTGTEVA